MVKNNMLRIILILVSLIIMYIISEAGGLFSQSDEIVFEINPGTAFNSIVSDLKEQDVINNASFFKAYSKIMAGSKLSDIKAGKVIIDGRVSYHTLLSLICSDERYAKTVAVTIPEGYNLKEIKKLLEEHNLIDSAEFDDAIKNYDFDYKFIKNLEKTDSRLEGYLFPDTYYFTEDDNEISIINSMLSNFNSIYLKYENEFKNSDYTLHENIILASIVEKEGGNSDDFKKVSSVFHNRLKRTDNLSYLQSCATVQYLMDEKKAVLSSADIAVDSPYNTYKYPGLPKGPIASPGEEAIKATLNPANTDYLYFQNDKDGVLHFTNNYDEHLRNMEKYQ